MPLLRSTTSPTGTPTIIPAQTRRLPTPPDEREKYSHLGPRRPWVPFLQLMAVALVSWSTAKFVTRIPHTEVFLIPLAVSVTGAVISFVTTIPRRREDRPDHEWKVAFYKKNSWASVDVFLPSCGEDVAILRNSYLWVSRMKWPGVLKVHVLDDSGRDEVKELSAEYGFTYHSRSDRGHLKKAGNLAFGYERTSGEFIVVFDADFCPRSDFLTELVSYFEEPDVGIVQSPQYFDVTDSMTWVEQSAAAEQEYFYRWVQPARDRSNAAICVGTNALYRRKALETTGGFARIDHSEDVYTGVQLSNAGYRTRYVPVVLAKGLCPDTMDQFITQQYRWCAGSLSLLFSWKFHRSSMSVSQRLCFWAGFLYYLGTALDVVLSPLPTFVVAAFHPDWIDPDNYVLLAAALFLWVLVHPVISGGRGKRLGLARIQILSSFAHFRALYDILRGRPASWTPTGATARSSLGSSVRLTMAVYQSLVQTALWGTVVWRAPGYGLGSYWPVALLAAVHLLVVYPLVTEALRGLLPRVFHRNMPRAVAGA